MVVVTYILLYLWASSVILRALALALFPIYGPEETEQLLKKFEAWDAQQEKKIPGR